MASLYSFWVIRPKGRHHLCFKKKVLFVCLVKCVQQSTLNVPLEKKALSYSFFFCKSPSDQTYSFRPWHSLKANLQIKTCKSKNSVVAHVHIMIQLKYNSLTWKAVTLATLTCLNAAGIPSTWIWLKCDSMTAGQSPIVTGSSGWSSRSMAMPRPPQVAC